MVNTEGVKRRIWPTLAATLLVCAVLVLSSASVKRSTETTVLTVDSEVSIPKENASAIRDANFEHQLTEMHAVKWRASKMSIPKKEVSAIGDTKLEEQLREANSKVNAATKQHDNALKWDRACDDYKPTNSTAGGPPTKYVVVGERDSGTNHIERLLEANFDSKRVQPFFKHMYDRDDSWFDRVLSNHFISWVFMVREPAGWLMAMYDNHHECGEMSTGRSFSQFLTASPWISIAHNNGEAGVLEGDNYTDILDLRRTKLRYMKRALEYAQQHPDTHRAVSIKHEEAADDPEAVLCEVHRKLGLPPLKPEIRIVLGESRVWLRNKNKGVVQQIERQYFNDGSEDALKATELLCIGLDWQLESWFGYSRPAACSR